VKEMVSETGVNPNKGTFGTSISFDIDDAPKPMRRKGREKVDKLDSNEIKSDEISNCPGCGADISHEEWLDCLVGFVSGAHDFEVGNPVRARIVQNLRNLAARMNVPSPTDSWELAVIDKLIIEIKRLVAAEVDRTNRKLTASNELGDKEREAIVIETENRVINTMALEIQEALIEQLTPHLEVQIRQQVEQELWAQFEEEWRNRTANS
tara:strand:- start:440 stop:1066 length:627 start_codon:yes stop_codon:yes gene_type:complete